MELQVDRQRRADRYLEGVSLLAVAGAKRHRRLDLDGVVVGFRDMRGEAGHRQRPRQIVVEVDAENSRGDQRALEMMPLVRGHEERPAMARVVVAMRPPVVALDPRAAVAAGARRQFMRPGIALAGEIQCGSDRHELTPVDRTGAGCVPDEDLRLQARVGRHQPDRHQRQPGLRALARLVLEHRLFAGRRADIGQRRQFLSPLGFRGRNPHVVQHHEVAIHDGGGDHRARLQLAEDPGIVHPVGHRHGGHPAFDGLAVDGERLPWHVDLLDRTAEGVLPAAAALCTENEHVQQGTEHDA